jgi:Putative MetA-pathway of phenol degradation
LKNSENLFLLIIFFLLRIILFPSVSSSQEMEPRNYSSVPVGLNVLALSYGYSTGNIIADVTSPVKDLELSSNTIGLGYLRSFGLFGKLCKVQAAVPFVFLNGSAKLRGIDTSGSRTGFADAKVKFVMNLIGTPALMPKDFAKFKEEFVLGASVSVSVPTGQYYDDKIINLGANRWGFKPEIGISYNKGAWFFEFFTGVWFFTKNTDYVNKNVLSQNPLFSLQGHISYLFPSKIWIALNSVFVKGGKTQLNGETRNDFEGNFRSGATLSVPIDSHNSLKANFSFGIATRIGGDFTIYSLTYQYLWF